MKLVLNQYRSGSSYKDEIGHLYHFPTRYVGLMQNLPMEFVYYEPRAGGNQVYFGTGIICNITEDSEEPGHYYAELADYRPFRAEVDYFTGPNDQSWEAAKTMRSSVRKIDKTIFDTLFERAG